MVFFEDLGGIVLAAFLPLRGFMPLDGGEGTDPTNDAAVVARSLPAGVEGADAQGLRPVIAWE